MRTGISITVSPSDRQRLEATIRDRTAPQKHVWRARIVLLTADGLGVSAIMRETGKSKTCVWRWQERFMEEGVDGLLRDKTRPPGKVFHSLADLQAAINRFVAEHNQNPAPFNWKAKPDDIIAAAKRGHQTLESIH